MGESKLSSETKLPEANECLKNPPIKVYDSKGNEVVPFPDDAVLERRYEAETDIETLRERCKVLEKEVRLLKEKTIKNFVQMEAEEEGITNRVIKRLDEVKKEKERLAIEVEREEEMLTNKLQRKLRQVLQEKIDIENQLEQEQENIINRYVREAEKTNTEKKQLEEKLNILSSKVDVEILQQLDKLTNYEGEEKLNNIQFSSPLDAMEKENILMAMGNEPHNFLKSKLSLFLMNDDVRLEKKTDVMVKIYKLIERDT